MNEDLRELSLAFPGETLPQLLRSEQHPSNTLEADIRYVKHILLVLNSILHSGSVSKTYIGAVPGVMTATGSLSDMTATLADAPKFYQLLNVEYILPADAVVSHDVIDRIRDATRSHVRYLKSALWCSTISKIFVKIAHGMHSAAAKASVPYVSNVNYATKITADFIISKADTAVLEGLLVRKTLIPTLPHLTEDELNLVAGLIEFTSKGREWEGPLLGLMKELKRMYPYLRIFRDCLSEEEFRMWSRTMTGLISKIPAERGRTYYTSNMSRLATRNVFIEHAFTQQHDDAPSAAASDTPKEPTLTLQSVNTFDNLNRATAVSASIMTVGAFVGTFLNTTIADDYSLSEEFLQKTNEAIAAAKPNGAAPDYLTTIVNGFAKIPHHVIQAVHGVMMGESATLGVISAVGVNKLQAVRLVVDGALRLRYAKHVLTTRTIFNRDGGAVSGEVSEEMIENLWSASLVVVTYGVHSYLQLLDMALMFANDGSSPEIQLTAYRKKDMARNLKEGIHRAGIESMVTTRMVKNRVVSSLIKNLDLRIAEHKGESATSATMRAAALAKSSQDEYRVAMAAMAGGTFSPSDGYQKSDRLLTSFNPFAQHLELKRNTLRSADGTLVGAIKVHSSDTLRFMIITKLYIDGVTYTRGVKGLGKTLPSGSHGLSEGAMKDICESHIAYMQSEQAIEALATTIAEIIKHDMNNKTT